MALPDFAHKRTSIVRQYSPCVFIAKPAPASRQALAKNLKNKN